MSIRGHLDIILLYFNKLHQQKHIINNFLLKFCKCFSPQSVKELCLRRLAVSKCSRTYYILASTELVYFSVSHFRFSFPISPFLVLPLPVPLMVLGMARNNTLLYPGILSVPKTVASVLIQKLTMSSLIKTRVHGHQQYLTVVYGVTI